MRDTPTLPAPGELEEELENPEMVGLPEKLQHQLRHRELFLSRQLESLPATHIRYQYLVAVCDKACCNTQPQNLTPQWTTSLPFPGYSGAFSSRGKCSVTLLNETESLKSYLEREVSIK